MSDSNLFQIDSLVVDGVPIAFEDASCTINGIHRYEREVMPSASGNDFSRRRRVPTTLNARLQFNGSVPPEVLARQTEVQITARDSNGGRRVVLPKCEFGSMGAVGAGSVDITYLVLAPAQWL